MMDKVPTAIKLEGGGVKALMARPLKNAFFAASLSVCVPGYVH